MKQHYGTIPITDLGPGEVSKQVITSGFYSLSTLSTCPYVRLIGSTGAQKLFSWNERVEIPEGETALVENASCHRGDIFINGGYDYSTLPARVTVPVPLLAESFGEGQIVFRPEYGLDTRRARRAFIAFFNNDPSLIPSSLSFCFVSGRVTNHSFNTRSELPFINPVYTQTGIGFLNVVELPAATIVPLIPLGYGASMTDPTFPHALLDCAHFTLIANDDTYWSSIPLTALYVLEY